MFYHTNLRAPCIPLAAHFGRIRQDPPRIHAGSMQDPARIHATSEQALLGNCVMFLLKSGSEGQGPPKVKTLIRHSIGKCQVWEPWPEPGNLALKARDPKSGDFNKALNRKVSSLGDLARIWKSGSEAQGRQKWTL